MSTVINNPGENGNDSGGGAGVVIGAALVVLVLVVVVIFAIPYVRQQIGTMTTPQNPTINVTLPNPVTPPANAPTN